MFIVHNFYFYVLPDEFAYIAHKLIIFCSLLCGQEKLKAGMFAFTLDCAWVQLEKC